MLPIPASFSFVLSRDREQLKGLSKSRSEPCFGSKREGKEKYSKLPFQVVLPLPPKGVDMRGETARDQVHEKTGLFS